MTNLESASGFLSDAIESRSRELRELLRDTTGLDFAFVLPHNMMALLEAAGLMTEGQIPLRMRGDGMQGLTVPAILSYLSGRSHSNYYFWGFEEPENSLEYRKGVALANNIRDSYSKQAQIFMSSHSPAFLAMKDSCTSIYRVSRKPETYSRTSYEELVTTIDPVLLRGEDIEGQLLPEELGFFEIAREFDQEYREEFEVQKSRIASLEYQVEKLSEPVLMVEGPHDVKTLNYAWRKLYVGSMPFKIVAADHAKAVTEIARRWTKSHEERLFALYDHDNEGVGAIRKLAGKRCLTSEPFKTTILHMRV